jgi:HEAT repeat protein
MNRHKGRLLAWGSAAGGLIVLLGCAVAFRDRIAEEWWLWRLGSVDPAARGAAAEKLGEMGSVRALPGLLKSCELSPLVLPLTGGGWADYGTREVAVWVREEQPDSSPVLPVDSRTGQPLESCGDPCLEALGKITGSRRLDSLRHLERALGDEDQQVRRRAAMVLLALGAEGGSTLSALESALAERHDDVIEYAVKELRERTVKS